jgi:hypothetical protein
MLALLGGAAATALAAVAGLVLLVVLALRPGTAQDSATTAAHPSTASTGTSAAGSGRTNVAVPGRGRARDVLAAKPMPTVDAQAARPGPVSLTPPGQIALPTATRTGPAGVPTGFPHTPQGALAQLAAIDAAAMQSGSLAGARAVLAGWALPGGPTGQSWTLIRGMAALLDQAGLSGGGSPRLALVLTPLMGLIKGTSGPDFVVPCVDFELDVTLEQTARAAVADCQRMIWTSNESGRWLIGPGREPAPAPSVWPDTDAAITAGYADLRAADHG